MTQFAPGQSGNPRGRPPGRGRAAQLRAAIEGRAEEVVNALFTAARAGDVQAAKALLDRVLPALRPVDGPVSLTLGDTLTDTGRAILEAVSGGTVTPDQAAKLLGGIGTLARVAEVDELSRRVEALEAQHADKSTQRR